MMLTAGAGNRREAMTTADKQLRAELNAVFTKLGRNLLTLDELALAGFPDARTLILRGFLKNSRGNGYRLGWVRQGHLAAEREGKHYGGKVL